MKQIPKIKTFFSEGQRTFRKRKVIYQPGSEAKFVYIVKEGMVKVYAKNNSKALIKLVAERGDLFGIEGLLNKNVHLNYAEAISRDCSISLIPINDFKELYVKNEIVEWYTLKQISKRRRWAEERLKLSKVTSMRKRIMRLVSKLALEWGEIHDSEISFECPLTQLEIGQLIGISRQCVNETLLQLRKEGILSIDRKQWHIRDIKQY